MQKKIPWAKPVFYSKEKEYVNDALDSTWISGGPYVERLEKEFTKYNQANYGLAVSNGTTALQAALLGLDIGPDAEVIVPGFTFIAPVNMTIGAGATPVCADVHPETWCIDSLSIEKSITKKTKAVIIVHTYGNVCDLDPIIKICQKNKLYLIEDTAEAAFSKYNKKYAGTLGDIGCFSFHATKTITTGEGGFVIAKDKAVYEKMKVVREHGMPARKRYWHDAVGYNFRLTNFQAALGCAQLESIEEIIAARKEMYQNYVNLLKEIAGVSLQKFEQNVDPVVWAVAVQLDRKAFQGDRDFIMEKMSEAGIETRPGFCPVQAMPIYKKYIRRELPVSQALGDTIISFPSFTSISTDEIEYICTTLKKLRK